MDNVKKHKNCINISSQTFYLIKFLGLRTDNHLNWINHIDQLVPKFSAACYAITSMLHISNTDTLRSSYFAVKKYGIIF
jgi:hypothetical protein